ncbi:hypothetical protein A9A89_1197 [Bifidobacterium psychraerophilum DSM 22366]|jgi:hypothetical protein|uniref:Uncharacterized protein n=1 Tax=Bifidobacterium psychraerophilum TaxID=218140 RepID=A0A087CFV6_9BIFI|nr:hypothetical protein BPSY_1005 [Bifidobacterium psychraerophilum]PKA94960.1 hypothetical protein A9A89_1197 [Bifidobacterium psychraerophilum DSM 22366]
MDDHHTLTLVAERSLNVPVRTVFVPTVSIRTVHSFVPG